MTLYLPLKREYFDQIKAGTKEFEYRLYNKYWRSRIENKTFDRIVLMLGYPKRGDKSRRIERPWRGYEVKEVMHREFGESTIKVFAIRVNPEHAEESESEE